MVFLSKNDKCLLDLALSMIIMDHRGRASLVEEFAIVKQCGCVLY